MKLVFDRPGEASLHPVPRREPGPTQLRVRSSVSAVSAGTEMLFFRGEVPTGTKVDETIPGYEGSVEYPLEYGYCNVGTVQAAGSEVAEWLDRRVFSFRGHASEHIIEASEVMAVPEALSDERAALFPMMETAVSLVMDARPMIGERVAVVGQGVVGILTAALLGHTAVDTLAVIDPIEHRRHAARALSVFEPLEFASGPQALADGKFDLVIELSGSPAGLSSALSLLNYSGRLILGSWYGTRATPVDLGALHRNGNRIHLSQVSQIAPEHTGRFDRQRRRQVAMKWLEALPVEELITHRVPLSEAPGVYELLDGRPDECLQVIIRYP